MEAMLKVIPVCLVAAVTYYHSDACLFPFVTYGNPSMMMPWDSPEPPEHIQGYFICIWFFTLSSVDLSSDLPGPGNVDR